MMMNKILELIEAKLKDKNDIIWYKNEIEQIDKKMDKLRDSYQRLLMKNEITRSKTTKYNADMDNLADRKKEIKLLMKNNKTNSSSHQRKN